MSMLVDVAIPRTKFDFLTYETDDRSLVGDLVLVPLRKKNRHGIVVSTGVTRTVKGIKRMVRTVRSAFMPQPVLELYRWIAEYYMASLGEVLTLALPADVLEKDEGGEPTEPAESAVSGADGSVSGPVLTAPQRQALDVIKAALVRECYSAFLLWGVTGSGKTEVYIRAAEETLGRGGRVLVLVPEISMTPLLLKRFSERFGRRVATIHSSLTAARRRTLWHEIKCGVYGVVIGPRSSVFLPVPGLKLIVVDEEHDQSYKEHQRSVRYHARDTAVMRANIEKITIVMGSATPQIETYHNAETGKYRLLKLEKRIDDRPMPAVEVIDVRNEKHRFISGPLERKLLETLACGQQAILFLNRRGYSPSLICPNCGFVARCPSCKLPMVSHRSARPGRPAYLSCHTCDHRARIVSLCPQCGKKTLLFKGAGTQRIEELVRRLIDRAGPTDEGLKYSAVRLDRDAVRKKGEAEKILRSVESRSTQVLIGTQLVTKGFDFPEVTLVGVINADTVLNLPDFRSGERTFQILTQVAGRTGRGSKRGVVYVQTYHPDQQAIIFSQLQDYPEFYRRELAARKELDFPPFSRLVLLRLKGKGEEQVWARAKELRAAARKVPGLSVFGPNNSYYYRIRDEYRVFILLKTFARFDRSKLAFLKDQERPGVVLEIDVDPQDIC